jgi:hypothetical protein
MTQAWDFVDALVLRGGAHSGQRVTEINLGKGYTARVVNAIDCNNRYRAEGGHTPVLTINDLIKELSEEQLLRPPNVGHKAVNALKVYLAEQGLCLRRW